MAPGQRGVFLHLSMGQNKVMFSTETKPARGGGWPNSNVLIEGKWCSGAPLRRREKKFNQLSSEFLAGYIQDVREDLGRSKGKAKNWIAPTIGTASHRVWGMLPYLPGTVWPLWRQWWSWEEGVSTVFFLLAYNKHFLSFNIHHYPLV